jgi:hypothetical protein
MMMYGHFLGRPLKILKKEDGSLYENLPIKQKNKHYQLELKDQNLCMLCQYPHGDKVKWFFKCIRHQCCISCMVEFLDRNSPKCIYCNRTEHFSKERILIFLKISDMEKRKNKVLEDSAKIMLQINDDFLNRVNDMIYSEEMRNMNRF